MKPLDKKDRIKKAESVFENDGNDHSEVLVTECGSVFSLENKQYAVTRSNDLVRMKDDKGERPYKGEILKVTAGGKATAITAEELSGVVNEENAKAESDRQKAEAKARGEERRSETEVVEAPKKEEKIEVEETKEGQLNDMTVKELKALCAELERPEDDYKGLNKAPLIAYIIAKDAETATAVEAEAPEGGSEGSEIEETAKEDEAEAPAAE